MIPLKNLRKVVVSEDFKSVYKHYLEYDSSKIESAYQELIKTLDTCHTNEKSRQINLEIKSQATIEDFTKKVYNYFFKILYIVIADRFNSSMSVSIKECVNSACNYAISEYLSVSIIKSVG